MKILLTVLILLAMTGCAVAQEIDIDAIIQIESSGNSLAYNKKEGAVGLCQVRRPALTEFNNRFKRKYDMKDLFISQINVMIGDWYYNVRVPELLRHYRIKDTARNRIHAYHDGISNVRRGHMSEACKNYIVKYESLTKD